MVRERPAGDPAEGAEAGSVGEESPTLPSRARQAGKFTCARHYDDGVVDQNENEGYRTNVEHCTSSESQDPRRFSRNAMTLPVLDVRALANLVLDIADAKKIDVSNMALNKIVFFVHSDHLIEQGFPLVGAKIEAWQHGPVFREIYHEFKKWGDKPIRGRATRVDPQSGEVILADCELGPNSKYISELIVRYVGFPAAYLRAISHRDDGPWHAVWGHDGRTNPGMSISNEIIIDHYSRGARQ